ncbi:hypothetical protein NPIL_106591, partial [Nephila pilipes]
DVPVPAPTPPVNIPKATPELTTFQKEWLERIEHITDGASLEDALAKFSTILGGRSFRRRGRGHKRSTSAASRAAPVDPPAESSSGAAGSSTGATSAGSSSTSKLKFNPAEASDIKNLLGQTRGEPSRLSCPGLPNIAPFHLSKWRPILGGVLAAPSGTRRSNFMGSLRPLRTTCCSPALTRRRSGKSSGGLKTRPPAPMGSSIQL